MTKLSRVVTLWLCATGFVALVSGSVLAGEAGDEATSLAPDEWVVQPVRAAKLISGGGVTVLDARDRAAWESGHVPGAMVVDWTSFTPDEKARRGVLSADDDALQETLEGLGVSTDRAVLVVGATDGGWGEAGRIVWMLRTLGHDHAALVDGGMSALVEAGVEQSQSSSATDVGEFVVARRDDWSIDRSELREIYDEDGVVLLDTRQSREYKGATPYGESRGGHIPGAKHLHFKSLLTGQGRLRSDAEIRGMLEERGVEKESRIITYCTGGVRSAWVTVVLAGMGYERVRNFAGSTWHWSAGPASRYPLETD